MSSTKTPGNKTYSVAYVLSVTQEDMPCLPVTAKRRIHQAIEHRLMLDPMRFGKPLRYSLKGYRRLRVGDYRIVYRIDVQVHTVLVVAIKHRRKIY